MAIDVPVTVYDYKDKEPTRKDMDKVAEEWAAKRKGKSLVGKKVSLNELFNS